MPRSTACVRGDWPRSAPSRTLPRQPIRQPGAGRRSAPHYLFGVPLHWMRDWPTPAPAVRRARRGRDRLRCADGHQYTDFCLGDTGAMYGHSPAPVAQAIAEQARRGLTAMLPSTLTAEVGRAAGRLLRTARWQVVLSATDANRFVLRWARAITGRPQGAGVRRLLPRHGRRHAGRPATAQPAHRDARQPARPGARPRTRHGGGAVQRPRGGRGGTREPATWPAC